MLLHPLAGVLSAYGMGLADVRALRERTVEVPLRDDAVEAADGLGAGLGAGRRPGGARGARPSRRARGAGLRRRTRCEVQRRAHVKYARHRRARWPVPWAPPRRWPRRFTAPAPERRYGFLMPGRGLVLIDALAVEAVGAGRRRGGDRTGRSRRTAEADAPAAGRGDGRARGERGAARPRQPRDASRCSPPARGTTRRCYERAALPRRRRASTGPAIVCEPTSTTVVEPGWRAEVLAAGELLLRRRSPAAPPSADLPQRSPLLLEVFNNLFMSIAEQMGATLANTACSVNIKERLDFSCALFDGDGGLVANAPHLPVHLGSMGASVQAVIARHRGELAPGDAYLLNSPYAGGTHLPDLTVVTPVFAGGAARDAAGEPAAARERRRRRPLFFVASRAHHADVGGITPGSMPPGSRTIDEEGVLIEDFRLVEGGELREAEVAALLSSAPYPVRDLAQNLADLRAQVAANARGVAELARMVGEFGLPVVSGLHAARAGQRRGGGAPRHRPPRRRRVPPGDGRRQRDRGARRRSTAHARAATVDFSGTSPQRARQLQRPGGGVHRRRPLRLPHARGRRHPAQRRLSQAAAHRGAAGLDARSGLPGRGRRRQRGDLAGDHQRPVRRPRRRGGLTGRR